MAIIRSNIEELVSKMSDLSVIPAVPRRLTRSGPRAWCWSTVARTAATLNGFVLALDTHATVSNPLFSSCNAVLFNELVPTDSAGRCRAYPGQSMTTEQIAIVVVAIAVVFAVGNIFALGLFAVDDKFTADGMRARPP